MSQFDQDGENGQKLAFLNSFGALLWPNGLTFSTVLKRFCPVDSKNVLEPELELFKV